MDGKKTWKGREAENHTKNQSHIEMVEKKTVKEFTL